MKYSNLLRNTKQLILNMLEESDTLDYHVNHIMPKSDGSCLIVAYGAGEITDRVIFRVSLTVTSEGVGARVSKGLERDTCLHRAYFDGEGERKEALLSCITELVEQADNAK